MLRISLALALFVCACKSEKTGNSTDGEPAAGQAASAAADISPDEARALCLEAGINAIRLMNQNNYEKGWLDGCQTMAPTELRCGIAANTWAELVACDKDRVRKEHLEATERKAMCSELRAKYGELSDHYLEETATESVRKRCSQVPDDKVTVQVVKQARCAAGAKSFKELTMCAPQKRRARNKRKR